MTTADPDTDALDAYSRVVTGVARRLGPSVASLRVAGGPTGRRRPVGAGSAIVLTPDGYLLTNAHVVGAHALEGTASFADGLVVRFRLVGRDALTDLAVVRADAADLAPAILGDAADLRIGQLVVAIGNPHGFGGSVSAGVVSGLGRSLPVGEGRATRVIDDVIQTDAALNPGSSGGALADSSGRVVGVNTAVAGVGLGLAVPVNTVTHEVVSALMRDGRVRRGRLGIAGGRRALPPWARPVWGPGTGVEVVEVIPGSPARAAGIRPEDLVVQVDGVRVATVPELQARLGADAIGRDIELVLLRAATELRVTVRPDELGEDDVYGD